MRPDRRPEPGPGHLARPPGPDLAGPHRAARPAAARSPTPSWPTAPPGTRARCAASASARATGSPTWA